MSTLSIIVLVCQLILAVALIVVITLQSGKSAGLSGSIGGGSETFFGQGKSKSKDAVLSSATKWIAGGFLVLTLVLALLGG